MSLITENRVIVASLFLPYTVDFQLPKEKKEYYDITTGPATNVNSSMDAVASPLHDTKPDVPDLITSLAAQKNPAVRPPVTAGQDEKEQLFDFKAAQQLVQPKSKAQREEELKRLAPLSAGIQQPRSRRPSLDCSNVFDNAPWTVKPAVSGNIGLQNAIHSIRDRLQHCKWVGTLGMPIDALSQDTLGDIRVALEAKYDSYLVMSPDAELEGHYDLYCKQVLWPNFHYVVQDDMQNMIYKNDAWVAYTALNQRFADVIVNNYQEGDIIWVNDYHLMLVPAMVRKKLPDAVIGFFLHLPFPSSELFRCLPTRKELLEGILASDLVGFQTYSFARHFLQTCSRILSLDSTPNGIQMDSHYVSVGIYPIGIDIDALNKKRSSKEVQQSIEMLREKYAGKKLIVGRDKLDSIKGVRQKLLAFEQFLIHHPEWHEKVVLIQIALSTSEQNELRAHISDVVARVNSKFGTIAYQPIVFLHQDISFSQYLALLTVADASLITPLRDGMNLTSHEYIVCQESHHGPLILSEFTGTYGSFGACLRVNPWDYRQVGNAIHEALSMKEEEKAQRWQEMYKSIVTSSAQNFASSIVSELSTMRSDTAHRMPGQIPLLDCEAVKAAVSKSKRPLFLFDYGGTLIPHGKSSGTGGLERVTEILKKLTQNPKIAVYVISGRTKAAIEQDLGDIPNLGLSAENGFYLKPRGEDWQQMLTNVDLSWMPAIREIFQYYTERTPGAWIETKNISLVWHFRTAGGRDARFAAWQAAECQNHIADSVNKNFAVHAVKGNTNIEVLPHDINKSVIANSIIQDIQPDLVLSIGDDRMDEDMFAYLNKLDIPHVITCTVGSRSTEAKYYVPNFQSVLTTLENIIS